MLYKKQKYISRLHCFLPCKAMGIPVELVSPNGSKNVHTCNWGPKNRFLGLIDEIDFSDINQYEDMFYKQISCFINNHIDS